MKKKIKKKSKSYWMRKLDKIISEIVRSKGSCAKCGRTDYSKLQCCHIFSRSNRAVRWNFLNVLCLCSGCHLWGHHNPVLFTEFVMEYLGNSNYELLKATANSYKKWTITEMEDYCNALTKEHYEQI